MVDDTAVRQGVMQLAIWLPGLCKKEANATGYMHPKQKTRVQNTTSPRGSEDNGQRALVELRRGAQTLKVALLVRGMLVYDEELPADAGDDKAFVELAVHAHAHEVRLAEYAFKLLCRRILRLPQGGHCRCAGGSVAAWCSAGTCCAYVLC